MKIEEVRSASLTDYEVFKHLVHEMTPKDNTNIQEKWYRG